MKPLYSDDQFKKAKSRQLLPLECVFCGKTFHRPKNYIQSCTTSLKAKCDFCSHRCQGLYNNPPIICKCEQCQKQFRKQQSDINKVKHHFCCKSCAAKYNNAHKTKGSRISKLEKWLQIQLPLLFPNLGFHFNRKDAINGELDIFIPSLKLAFELNGVFHYEPIYGPEKLDSIQTNDGRKMQACLEKGIELCIVDVSSLSYFKEERAKKFLTIIQDVILLKLSRFVSKPIPETT